MKKTITSIITILTVCSTMFAYSYHPVFDLDHETINEIKLIEDLVNQNGAFLSKIIIKSNF